MPQAQGSGRGEGAGGRQGEFTVRKGKCGVPRRDVVACRDGVRLGPSGLALWEAGRVVGSQKLQEAQV